MKTIITLKSGRTLDPNCGFLGINESLIVCEGYDSRLFDPRGGNYWDEEDVLSWEERQEIATLMIDRWRAWGRRP